MKNILIILSFLFTLNSIHSQSEKEKVASTITKEKIEGHIYFLADDLLMGRETGTSENKIAASYLANTLRSYGVKPVRENTTNSHTSNYFQEVKLQKTSPPKNLTLSINGKEIKYKVPMKVSEIDFEGSGVYLGYGLESDYKGNNVSKKIVIVKSGSPNITDPRKSFALIEQKQELAKEHGAVAVVELTDLDENVWSYLEHNYNVDRLEVADAPKNDNKTNPLAYLWVKDENNNYAKSLESKKNISLKFVMDDSEKLPILSQNVIGMVEGTDPKLKDEFIIYSAHYDHVGIGQPDATGDTIYNGARDNAVGTTTVLSMAENLAKYPTKRSALFILFTGEEKGLLGSKYYVETINHFI